MLVRMVARGGIGTATQGFSVLWSNGWATDLKFG